MSKTQITTSNRVPREKLVTSARTSRAAGTLRAATASISSDRSTPVTDRSATRPASTAPVPQPSSSSELAAGRYRLM